MTDTAAPHTTVKCVTCGADSCHGNYIVEWAKGKAYEVCSCCRQRLVV